MVLERRVGNTGAESLAASQRLLFQDFKEGKRFYKIVLEFGVFRRYINSILHFSLKGNSISLWKVLADAKELCGVSVATGERRGRQEPDPAHRGVRPLEAGVYLSATGSHPTGFRRNLSAA